MKKKLENYRITSIKTLKDALTDLWCRGMDQEALAKFTDSMPARLKEVIHRKGGATSY